MMGVAVTVEALTGTACFCLTFTAAFLTQTVCLDDTTVKFEIWDTAGQERYHSLAPMYYRGAQAAIVVYDITSMVRIYSVSFIVFISLLLMLKVDLLFATEFI